MTTLTLNPRQDYPTLSLVALAHGTSHFYHLLLPPLFPWLMPAFGLSFTQAGALMTMFFVVSGFGQAAAGFVVDRFGASRVLFGGLALLALAALTVGAASGYPMLLAGAALAGLGNSVFHPADYTILNRRVTPGRLGQAFSLHGLAGNAGWVLAPVFLTAVAASAGWRVAAFSASGLSVFTMLVLLQARELIEVELLPAAPLADRRAGAEATGSWVPLFMTIPAVWLCFGFFLSSSAAFGTLQNYLSPLLGQVYGMSRELAASGLTAYLVGGAAGTASGGLWARAGHRLDRTIGRALGVSAVAASLLATHWVPAWLVLPLLAVMGFGVGFAGPSRDLLVRAAATGRLGDAALGRVYGFVYSGLDAGLALGPLLFGPFMDRGHFLSVLAGVALLQFVAILFTRRVSLVSAPAAMAG